MASAHYLETDIIKRVAHIAPDLPEAQRRLAMHVLDNAFQVASGSIESLAAATGVSIATANRFACALGYAGYADFRHALFQVFKPSMAPVEKLRRELGRDSSPEAVVHESLAGSADGVALTANGLSQAGVNQAIAMISAARNVYCLGLGTSGHLSDIAAFRFAPYCESIHSLASHGGAEMALYHLQKIRDTDLLLAISFPRYSADILRIMRFAKSRKAAILALTDKPTSPLMALADHTLFAQAEHQVFSSSMVAPLALVEALAAAMAHRNPEGLGIAAELTGQLLPYFYLDKAPDDRPGTGNREAGDTPAKSQRAKGKKAV